MERTPRMTMQEDISLQDPSSSLWEIQKRKPEIRQIYGHFLPPSHRELVKGLVAKDFNFPPAYYDASNMPRLHELYEIGERIGPDTIVSLSNSIKIRPEEEGGIVYTAYFNGFYVNDSAYQILKCCASKEKVEKIVSTLGIDLDTVLEFLARSLTLGIVNVCPS
jgi:hypothetical protein